ncbi:MAG: hypothetical protein ACO1N3_00355 [Gammaproteobacteria bacterium]
MEADRYQKHHVAYICGLFCLIASIVLFAFSLFLLPFLFFGWQYSVPEFVINFSALLQDKYTLSNSAVAWAICFALDFPAVILFVIADVLSNRIDKEIYGIQNSRYSAANEQENISLQPTTQVESGKLIVKIVLLIVIIFIVAQFFHWVIVTK